MAGMCMCVDISMWKEAWTATGHLQKQCYVDIYICLSLCKTARARQSIKQFQVGRVQVENLDVENVAFTGGNTPGYVFQERLRFGRWYFPSLVNSIHIILLSVSSPSVRSMKHLSWELANTTL